MNKGKLGFKLVSTNVVIFNMRIFDIGQTYNCDLAQYKLLFMWDVVQMVKNLCRIFFTVFRLLTDFVCLYNYEF